MLIYIFSIIKKIKRNTIYLLEEPETNLHPKLQRVLLEKIFSVKKAQFFIATHSPIFINTIEDKEVSIFETKTNTINLIYKQNSLLNSLGIKDVYISDVCTKCSNKPYFSYRDDNKCGRFAAVIELK